MCHEQLGGVQKEFNRLAFENGQLKEKLKMHEMKLPQQKVMVNGVSIGEQSLITSTMSYPIIFSILPSKLGIEL